MIRSIFGPTAEELKAKRMERAQDLLGATFNTRDFETRQAQQAGSLLGLGAAFLTNKYFGDSGMEKAREAEEKQAALNKQLNSIDRADDPRRFMILADAAREVGDETAYTKYIQLAAQYEELGERRRQKYRDEEQKQADELAEALDNKDLSEATIALAKNPNDENAIRTITEIGGTNAPNIFYAADNLRKNMGGQGITKRQADITDKFVSDLSNGVVSPAEVFTTYESIYGDDFIVPESFLDQFKTDKGNPGDGTGGNDGNGGNPPAGGTGKELGIDDNSYTLAPNLKYWDWYSKQKEQEEPEEPVDQNKLGIRQLKLPNLNFTTYKDLY